jgi:competence protein ComFB
MATQDSFVLINAVDQTVRMKVTEMMANIDMCKCEKCYLDVCMHALNQLPNKYVTSKKGEVISNIYTTAIENNVAYIVAITTAIETVRDNPLH